MLDLVLMMMPKDKFFYEKNKQIKRKNKSESELWFMQSLYYENNK